MNKIIVFALLILSSTIISCNQQKKAQAVVSTPTPPVKDSLILTNMTDSTSYAIGVSVASFYKEQGIGTINTAMLTAAVTDILAGKKPILDEPTCNSIMNQAISKAAEQKSRVNLDAGIAFLEQNKLRPEVKTTASGLQYEVIKEGTGIKPGAIDSVTCHYRGSLVDGTEFDNSFARGAPITFALNRVIAGWTEGLQLMSVGSKYKFFIPHTLAYGTYDNGPIPGGSALIFEVELLNVKKAAGQ